MTLSEAGSIASVLSFFFTGWVIFEVRSLHLFYKRHLLLPQFIRELKRHTKNARKALKAKRTEEVRGIFLKCDALIERVPKYADKALTIRAKRVRDSISELLDERNCNLLGNSHDVLNEIEATIESALAFTGEDKWSAKT